MEDTQPGPNLTERQLPRFSMSENCPATPSGPSPETAIAELVVNGSRPFPALFIRPGCDLRPETIGEWHFGPFAIVAIEVTVLLKALVMLPAEPACEDLGSLASERLTGHYAAGLGPGLRATL